MGLHEVNNIHIKEIIASKAVDMHFQPVVSVVKQSIVGLEALARGTNPQGNLISPNVLFDAAAQEGLTNELDRLCRYEAVDHFIKLPFTHSDFLLFMNLDTSALDKVVGSSNLINMVNELGLNPENIVIEINQSKIKDYAAIKQFINTYRGYGFLIALDDVGYGSSNLDGIAYIEPDIIKIDRAIIKNIHCEYYNQEVFHSLVNLSKKIGALVVAEGIESEEEAVTVLELGADMLQGFYFAKPQHITEDNLDKCLDSIKSLVQNYRGYMDEKISYNKLKHREYDIIINNMVSELSALSEDKFDAKLYETIRKHSFLECAYVLDETGIQVSDTATLYPNLSRPKRLIFQPAQQGADHSLKKYYYFLTNMDLNKYVTEPYISLATGNLCITISSIFENVDKKRFILCIDFNPDHMNI